MKAKDMTPENKTARRKKHKDDPNYLKFVDIVKSNIKRIMGIKGLTQDSILNKMSEKFQNEDMYQSQLSRYINGENRLDAYDLYRIACSLEVSVEELISASRFCSSNNDLNNTVIKNIRGLMSLASPKISEEKLGEIIGLTQYDVGKCMGGSDTFTLEQISKIADYFSVSVDYLLGKNTYSNFDVCRMISDLILNGNLVYEIEEKSEDVWEYPFEVMSEYEQVRNKIGLMHIGFIERRVDGGPGNNEKHSKIIKYLTFYFPMYKKLSENEDTYYDDLDEYESNGNLNDNNVIINQFLADFTNSIGMKEKNIINEDEFKARIDAVFSKVMKYTLDEKIREILSLPEIEDSIPVL